MRERPTDGTIPITSKRPVSYTHLETVKESPYLIYIHVYDNKVYFVDMSDPGRNKICISTGELPLVAENVDESYGSDLDRAILANIGWQWCDNKS